MCTVYDSVFNDGSRVHGLAFRAGGGDGSYQGVGGGPRAVQRGYGLLLWLCGGGRGSAGGPQETAADGSIL